MEAPLIQFTDVRKAFGPKVIYHRLNLAVRRGTSLTIVGGSGVGKSVMLKMLIHLLVPDAGSVMFDGQEVTRMKEGELAVLRRRIAMLFQAGALFDSLSVAKNVAYGLEEHFRDTLSQRDVEERVAWALELVGLPGIEEMWPADLSGGMKKRVALARAIALDPEVIFCDEPTAGLDPIVASVIVKLIMDLREKLRMTALVVTHDIEYAFRMADRVIMLYRGRLVASGSPEELRRHPDPVLQQFLQGSAEGPIPMRRSGEEFLADLMKQ